MCTPNADRRRAAAHPSLAIRKKYNSKRTSSDRFHQRFVIIVARCRKPEWNFHVRNMKRDNIKDIQEYEIYRENVVCMRKRNDRGMDKELFVLTNSAPSPLFTMANFNKI